MIATTLLALTHTLARIKPTPYLRSYVMIRKATGCEALGICSTSVFVRGPPVGGGVRAAAAIVLPNLEKIEDAGNVAFVANLARCAIGKCPELSMSLLPAKEASKAWLLLFSDCSTKKNGEKEDNVLDHVGCWWLECGFGFVAFAIL